jgi:hypothetical protein
MKKMFDLGVAILIITMLVTTIGSMAHKFSNKENPKGAEYKGDDCAVEEGCEAVLEVLTGTDTDLTPDSPEIN